MFLSYSRIIFASRQISSYVAILMAYLKPTFNDPLKYGIMSITYGQVMIRFFIITKPFIPGF